MELNKMASSINNRLKNTVIFDRYCFLQIKKTALHKAAVLANRVNKTDIREGNGESTNIKSNRTDIKNNRNDIAI
jgi:hypothetical protein